MTALSLSVFWTVLKEGLPPDQEQPDERTKHISDRLVQLVQVFFGVVAGQGLILYRNVVVSPFDHDQIPAALALVSIYVMIVWSWIDWNTSMEDHPYDFRTRAPTRVGRWQTRRRALAALLGHRDRLPLQLHALPGRPARRKPRAPISATSCSATRSCSCSTSHRVSCGFFATAASPRTCGRSSSSSSSSSSCCSPTSSSGRRASPTFWLNCLTIGAAIVDDPYLSLAPRPGQRRSKGACDLSRRRSLGVDLDGVLANQIVGVLPLVEATYGVVLSYDEIVDWRASDRRRRTVVRYRQGDRRGAVRP